MKSFAYLPIHHKLHETPLKQDKHVDTVKCESFVYTLCLNRAIQEHIFIHIFLLFAFEENLRRVGLGAKHSRYMN